MHTPAILEFNDILFGRAAKAAAAVVISMIFCAMPSAAAGAEVSGAAASRADLPAAAKSVSAPAGQAKKAVPADTAGIVGAEEYAVIAAVIDGVSSDRSGRASRITDAKAPVLFISSSTISCKKNAAKYIRMDMPEASEAVASDFAAKNIVSAMFEKKFDIRFQYILIDRAAVSRTIGSKDAWSAFYKDNPAAAGIFEFSRAAFNAASDEALVEAAYHAGPMSGFGKYFLLKKVSGKWTVVKAVTIWMS